MSESPPDITGRMHLYAEDVLIASVSDCSDRIDTGQRLTAALRRLGPPPPADGDDDGVCKKTVMLAMAGGCDDGGVVGVV